MNHTATYAYQRVTPYGIDTTPSSQFTFSTQNVHSDSSFIDRATNDFRFPTDQDFFQPPYPPSIPVPYPEWREENYPKLVPADLPHSFILDNRNGSRSNVVVQQPQVFIQPEIQQFRVHRSVVQQPQVVEPHRQVSKNIIIANDEDEGNEQSGSGYSSFESSCDDQEDAQETDLIDSPHGGLHNHHSHFSSPVTTPVQTPSSKSIKPLALHQIEEILSEIAVVIRTVEDSLCKLDLDIKNSGLPMSLETSSSRIEYLGQLQHSVEANLESCHEIKNQQLLHCKHLFELNERCNLLNKLMTQIDLYRKEIEHCVSGDYGDVIFAALFIIQQPFPATIKQHLGVDTVRVQLLTAARTRIDVSAPVKAEMITDWNIGNNKKQGTPMKGHEEKFSSDATVSFRSLKFTVGTGCKAVQIKFKTILQRKNQKFQFESEPSESFIVMTNTKQWAEAQGILTKRELFKDSSEVTAQYFANVIQLLYIQASRQDPRKASRPLGPLDFQFIFENKIVKTFSYQQIINQADFDRLWLWFGPVLQKIRYQKFLLPMWTGGLFWGFISKSDSEKVLEPYDVGTFILRFSVMNNGSMAVAYKQSKTTVRHYLIKSKDTSGQGHSLPQFIRDTSSLQRFLRLNITEAFEIQFSLVDKNQALAKIGSSKRRKTADNKGSGYDEWVFDLDAATKNLKIKY